MREKSKKLELSLSLKKITGFPIRFMTGASVVIAMNQSRGWVFLCSWSFHTFSSCNYRDGGMCHVCTVYIKHTVYGHPLDKFSLPSIYLFLIVL